MTLRRSSCPSVLLLIASALCLITPIAGYAYIVSAQVGSPARSAQEAASPSRGKETLQETTAEAIIHPYRSASVGAEVGGVIEAIRFSEGDLVKKDQVVAEISKRRYQVLADKTADALKATELAHKRAVQDVAIRTELLSNNAVTRQEVLRAETEADIAAARVEEARKVLTLAQLNLEDCSLKAPFTGHLAVRYKQPFETVQRLEKVFALVDTSRVYAVASIPGEVASRIEKGTPAVFEDGPARSFQGTVDKVAKLTDPKTGTTRVYVLIDNPAGDVRVGMSGTMKFSARGAR
ncbi:MAG: efflux RND transporter periplasmic adaptor subunit [Thermodesulfobacteriota bacterium]